MAALWTLPVVYVCENNLYNEYTHYSETTAGDISARAAAFGIPVEEVDGQDVRGRARRGDAAVERARSGGGPAFVLCQTYRFMGHHVGDVDRAYYRSKEEEQEWRRRDPLELAGRWLLERRSSTRRRSSEIDVRVHRARSPRPSSSRSRRRSRVPTRWTSMSTPSVEEATTSHEGTREISLAQAVNEALAEELRRDPTVFIIGEDVAEAGDAFKVLTGLVEEFGTAAGDRLADLRGRASPASGSARR